MLKSLKRSKLAAFALLTLAAHTASADQLFTNWSGSVVGGGLYTAGGPCQIASCFGIADNFSNLGNWVVTDITVYIGACAPVTPSNWRFAVFTTAGVQVVAPTDTSIAFTDLGPHPNSNEMDMYQGVISGLNISLPADEYELRFTNTQSQCVVPLFGSSTSAQTLPPGFVQLTGSSTTESLLSTDRTQRTEEWAFEIGGTETPIFADGFEGM